jgi:hypothetical protein
VLVQQVDKHTMVLEKNYHQQVQSYDLEDVLFGLGTGIKPQVVDLKRSMNLN